MSIAMEEAFETIETWDKGAIKKVLAAEAENPGWEEAIAERYRPLMDQAGITELKRLSTLPKKLTTMKVLKKEWEPDEVSIGILEGMPVDEIKLTRMKSFPRWAFHFKRLKALHLHESQLQELPDLRGFGDLRELGLYQNRLKQLPPWLSYLPLERLEVSCNELETVPEVIGALPRLKMLDLSHNKLREIPDFLGECSALEELWLGANELSALGETLSGLKELDRLVLSYNRFTELPEVIKTLGNLRFLDFRENPVASLLPWIGSLTRLRELNLDGTNVEALPREIRSLELLRCLYFRETPLGEKQKLVHSTEGDEIRDFLDEQFPPEKDPAGLYADLESCKELRIKKALILLKKSPDLWKRAEKRYLGFIRARLNDPAAGLADLPRAALSLEEEKLLLEGSPNKTIDRGALWFSYFDDSEAKLIVDFAGGMVSSLVDIDAYLEDARKCRNLEDLRSFAMDYKNLIHRAIRREAQIYKAGWFGKVYSAFAGLHVDKVRLDHTKFGEANGSPVLREFYLFLASSCYGNFSMDIFQSDTPDLTDVFWTLYFPPDTSWGDTMVDIPKSILPFTRTAKIRRDDFSDWKEIESEPAGE